VRSTCSPRPTCFRAARAMTGRARLIVCHMGLTTGGNIGAETARPGRCVALIDDGRRRPGGARGRAGLCHGGPMPAADRRARARACQHCTASTAQQHGALPTERALTEHDRAFKNLLQCRSPTRPKGTEQPCPSPTPAVSSPASADAVWQLLRQFNDCRAGSPSPPVSSRGRAPPGGGRGAQAHLASWQGRRVLLTMDDDDRPTTTRSRLRPFPVAATNPPSESPDHHHRPGVRGWVAWFDADAEHEQGLMDPTPTPSRGGIAGL